ncbi:MAG: hypothetical protein A2Y25_01300 [Candidatus Melainabacteria bacterium GWF2_37_15]|nr:MAG: hypothetical protein A2Y25_01300 [Candidatus Melainabacteria bacterium GWF2_37_15]
MNKIIETHKRSIQNIIMSMAGKNNVQDIEQEVYIKVWKNLNKYKEQGNLWGWIKTITVNTCKDHLKSKQFSTEMKTTFDEETFLNIKDIKPTSESTLLLNERKKLILEAIETLKPKFKEVIIFYDIKEMSYEEIAGKIKCPTGTVKSRLFNARKQLQKELEERGIL